MDRPIVRLSAFGAGLVAVFAAALALGAAVGPVDVGGESDHHNVPATLLPHAEHSSQP